MDVPWLFRPMSRDGVPRYDCVHDACASHTTSRRGPRDRRGSRPSKDGARARALWGDLFPTLGADEALVEGIFTAEDHRRKGIMGHAMARIAEAAKERGVRRVLVFVSERNAASLKGCQKAGFVPYVERTETWLLFRRRVRFTRV